jgi:hypothetical protein
MLINAPKWHSFCGSEHRGDNPAGSFRRRERRDGF